MSEVSSRSRTDLDGLERLAQDVSHQCAYSGIPVARSVLPPFKAEHKCKFLKVLLLCPRLAFALEVNFLARPLFLSSPSHFTASSPPTTCILFIQPTEGTTSTVLFANDGKFEPGFHCICYLLLFRLII